MTRLCRHCRAPLGESEQGDECEVWLVLCALRAPRFDTSAEQDLVADAIAAWVGRSIEAAVDDAFANG